MFSNPSLIANSSFLLLKAYLQFSSSSSFYSLPISPGLCLSCLEKFNSLQSVLPCLIPLECLLHQSARLMILKPNQTSSFCCLTPKFSNCFNSLLWSSITCFSCHFLFPPHFLLMPQPFLPLVMKRSPFSVSCWLCFFFIQTPCHLQDHFHAVLAAQNSFNFFLGFCLNQKCLQGEILPTN